MASFLYRFRGAAPLLITAFAAVGCGEPPCTEPMPSGDAALGEPCLTAADCVEGLTCIGRSFEQDAICSDPADLPGGSDPGCLEHAGDWEHHEAHGVSPTTPDEEGCEILVFESACNCIEVGEDEGCTPSFPRYRLERWRSCNGCCWRLIAFWEEPAACEV